MCQGEKYKYETHCHTFESSACGISSAATQVKEYKSRGYTGIIVTDHLKTLNFSRSRFKYLKPLLSWEEKVSFMKRGYEKAKIEGEKLGLDVFFGWEFGYMGSDFLTYGLDVDFLLRNRNLDEIPIEAYSKLVRENGGYIAQAHPYRKLPDGKRQSPVEPSLLDGVEVFNAQRYTRGHAEENDKALEFARKHNKPMQSGTDTHQKDRKFYSGVKLKEKAKSIFDIINAIKSREVELILPGHKSDLMEEDDLLVKIFYDTEHAKKAAYSLCDYITEHLEIDALCVPYEQEGLIDRAAKVTKTIILGRHSDARAKLNYMKGLQYHQYGTKYGVEDNLCVMTVSRSELKGVKDNWKRFVLDYNSKFNDSPEDEHTRTVQFNYLVKEFIDNGLTEFLNISQKE